MKNKQECTTFMMISINGAMEEVEVTLPTKFKVCPRCSGKGTHVNPSIDGNGLTQEDFDQDPDFKADYLGGAYDVACYRCEGQRVIAVLDRAKCTKEQIKAYDNEREAIAEMDAIQAAERRFGC